MTTPDLEAFYGRYISALNSRDFATVASLIADEVQVNGTSYKREDVVTSLEGMADAVPDFHWAVQDLFTDEHRIAARLHDTGKPVKPFLGLEPTGASFSIIEYGSYRVENGRFADMWFLIDVATASEQLRSVAALKFAEDVSSTQIA